jgi:hypothetical protein
MMDVASPTEHENDETGSPRRKKMLLAKTAESFSVFASAAKQSSVFITRDNPESMVIFVLINCHKLKLE